MQREFKFRVWIPSLNEMSKKWMQKYLDFTGIIDSHEGNREGVWMQYTGLKDKNGKEIYEGDILEHMRHNGNSSNFLIHYTDERLEWTAHDEALHYGGTSLRSYFRIATTGGNAVEIIGNIFENPELVEGGKTTGGVSNV